MPVIKQHAKKKTSGEVEIKLHTFLISDLVEESSQFYFPVVLPMGKDPWQWEDRRLGGRSGYGGEVKNPFPSRGLNSDHLTRG